jgi:hypothetical protein
VNIDVTASRCAVRRTASREFTSSSVLLQASLFLFKRRTFRDYGTLRQRRTLFYAGAKHYTQQCAFAHRCTEREQSASIDLQQPIRGTCGERSSYWLAHTFAYKNAWAAAIALLSPPITSNSKRYAPVVSLLITRSVHTQLCFAIGIGYYSISTGGIQQFIGCTIYVEVRGPGLAAATLRYLMKVLKANVIGRCILLQSWPATTTLVF